MSLATKYRPRTLDQIIGHEDAVSRARGMAKAFENGTKLPAVLISGPSSSGKTTFARALASAVMGVQIDETGHRDMLEVDGASHKTLDTIDKVIRVALLKPQQARVRVVYVDEAQMPVSNKDVANRLLKIVEEPHDKLLWIFSSMEPQKFSSGNGLAIAKRCVQFQLEYPTPEQLRAQAIRIAKGERMGFMSKEAINEIVAHCGGEYRMLANAIEAVRDWHSGQSTPPAKVPVDRIVQILTTQPEENLDECAVLYLTSVYSKKVAGAYRALMDVENGMSFLNKLIWANKFLIYLSVNKDGRHPKIWWTPLNKALKQAVGRELPNLGMLCAVDNMLAQVKAMTFSPEEQLGAGAYRVILEVTTQH